jgi:hypothetical protein
MLAITLNKSEKIYLRLTFRLKRRSIILNKDKRDAITYNLGVQNRNSFLPGKISYDYDTNAILSLLS